MIVVLRRAWCDYRATIGMLTVLNHVHDPIFTLENPLRDTDHDSRIPAGHYDVELYSGTKYKDVFKLKHVPGRTDILIHWGNFEKDTEGCILLGNKSQTVGRDPAVLNSRLAFDYFSMLVNREPFSLTILENW